MSTIKNYYKNIQVNNFSLILKNIVRILYALYKTCQNVQKCTFLFKLKVINTIIIVMKIKY